MQSKIFVAILAGATIALSGCYIKEIEGSRHSVANNDPGPIAQLNQAPTITGAPPPSVLEGQPYDFTPAAVDPDGDTLTFSISRKPGWATFDKTTGRLSGTPDAQNVGTFTNIGITVSDGQASAALSKFDISVDAIALGQATLSWMPPTSNDDGSPLMDLSGYRIYYGRNQGDLTRVARLDNPGLTRYVVESLVPAKWFFAMTAVNSQGVESNRSPIVSKTIT